jgi:hypothetical protein
MHILVNASIDNKISINKFTDFKNIFKGGCLNQTKKSMYENNIRFGFGFGGSLGLASACAAIHRIGYLDRVEISARTKFVRDFQVQTQHKITIGVCAKRYCHTQ